MTTGSVAADQTNYFYVVTNNPSAQAPYTNWAWAATNIQVAVNVAQSNAGPGTNCVVLVSNGTYQTLYGVSIRTGLVLRSVNGADATVVRRLASDVGRSVTVYATATNTVLDGFTLTGGSVNSDGGGVYAAASNCLICNCVISSNYALTGGGGLSISDGMISNCVVVNNAVGSGNYGGGVQISGGNMALVNCLIAGNDGGMNGGGVFGYFGNTTMENCTLTGNRSSGVGGVRRNSGNFTLRNCIVYNNLGNVPANDNYSGFGVGCFTNSCASPLPSGGTNNIAVDPLFVNSGTGYGTNFSGWDCRLSPISPCIDVGTNQSWMGNATDLYGNPRLSGPSVDMGVYEEPASTNGSLRVGIEEDKTEGFVPLTVVFTGIPAGEHTNNLYYRWVFGDGQTTNGLGLGTVTNTYTVANRYYPYLTLSNDASESCTTYGCAISAGAPAAHVATNGGNIFPYDTWARAATNIPSALSAVVREGATLMDVVVSNGIYVAPTVVVAKGARIRSVNGAINTIVKSGQAGYSVVTLSATASNAVIEGFTITGGYVGGTGGGVSLGAPDSVLYNCIVSSNAAGQRGGGLYLTASCTISNCILTSNYNAGWGGGACVSGGNALFVNCLFTGNDVSESGGGLYNESGSTLMKNCTVAGNRCAGVGSGGVRLNVGTLALENCILYNNLSSGISSNWSGGSYTNCCTAPLPTTGTNNMASDPLFLAAGTGYGTNFVGWNCRLSSGSPCVNAGTNRNWMVNAQDLDGKPRIVRKKVDMGAYEYVPREGTMIALF
jgi:hypothetical protein